MSEVSNAQPNSSSANEEAATTPKKVLIKPRKSSQSSAPDKVASNELNSQTNSEENSVPFETNPSAISTPEASQKYQWIFNDLVFLVAIALSFYLVIIFAGYSPNDPGFVLVNDISDEVVNYGGETGAWLSSFIFFIFGVFGYLLPIGITIGGWMTLKHPSKQKSEVIEQDYTRFLLSLLGVMLFISSGAAMSNLFMPPDLWLKELPFSNGGVWGYTLSTWLVDSIDLLATTLLLLGIWAWSLSLLLNRSWMNIFEITGELTENLGLWFYHRVWKGEKPRKIFHLTKLKVQSGFVKKSSIEATETSVGSAGNAGNLTTEPKSIFARAKETLHLATKGQKVTVTGVASNQAETHQPAVVKEQSIDVEKAKQLLQSSDQTKWQTAEVTERVQSSSDEPSKAPLSTDAQLPLPEVASVQATAADKRAPENTFETPPWEDDSLPLKSTKAQSVSEEPISSAESGSEPFSVHIGQRSQSLAAQEIKQKAELPSLELLDEPPVYEQGYTEEELTTLSYKLEQSLSQFGVEASVESVQPGPVVTRFEILPAPGIKVSKINTLSKDLARVMMVESVRVVEVIVGKSVIGIEIPNKIREVVSFREVLASKTFQESQSPLSIALGKDISGEPVVADIAKMPHLLVAGTTGAGKSVGVNSMILSMLFKSTADEVRMILIDPKMLELSIYEDIPHLLTPVVTDMNDAANALRWCVFEMDRRYELMAKLKVRNIAGFNLKVREAIDKGKPIIDPLHEQLKSYGYDAGEAPPTLEPLPFIVVVIDEFADMIMTVGKEVEQLIARLAQKARAAGIHLILATQRPSVNVITGLIKANIPTRIAFMVNTKIDSRTILEQGGAEQLLGRGDMLYMPPGSGSTIRVHGAFMTDEEVNAVAEFVKSQGEPQYLKAITEAPPADDDGKGGSGNAEDDPLYDEVVAFITEKRKVSVSLLQRHFSIGYNRSARIVEGLEAAGLVSSGRGGNNVREVLIPRRDDYDNL